MQEIRLYKLFVKLNYTKTAKIKITDKGYIS